MNILQQQRVENVIAETHYALLNKKDPRMFSFATPTEVARMNNQINYPDTGVVSKLEQIVQDIEKSVQAMAIIHKAKGSFVPDLPADALRVIATDTVL